MTDGARTARREVDNFMMARLVKTGMQLDRASEGGFQNLKMLREREMANLFIYHIETACSGRLRHFFDMVLQNSILLHRGRLPQDLRHNYSERDLRENNPRF